MRGGGSVVVDWLLELMEEVWRTGVVPQDWKDAELVLLYKKEGRLQCDNYCGNLHSQCARECVVPDSTGGP